LGAFGRRVRGGILNRVLFMEYKATVILGCARLGCGRLGCGRLVCKGVLQTDWKGTLQAVYG